MTDPCPKCNGRGVCIDENNHSVICAACCKHDLGWWKLANNPGYGDKAGKWACMRGCGTVKEENPNDN